MPFDGGDKTGKDQSIAIDSQGRAAIAAYRDISGADNLCGSPKLHRSNDNVNWTVCGADLNDSLDVHGRYVSLSFAGNDKLYLGFQQLYDRKLVLG